jgi:hypothetical protein
VNVGGDPERDDSGLPPIDIVIPDDARELDRDVQAYQRELRALRRRQRASRLRMPLTRDGMVLPLLAGCLVLALITSTLLIMFAAGQTGMPQIPNRATSAPPTRPASTQPAAGQAERLLLATVLLADGKHEPLSAVTANRPSVVALIPLACNCASALRQLGRQAAQANVPLYLVGAGGTIKQVQQLAIQAGQSTARVAEAQSDDLGGISGQGVLTAILVRSPGTVAVTRLQASQRPNLETSLRQLRSAGK